MTAPRSAGAWTATPDPDADPALYLAPLDAPGISDGVAKDLERTGHGKCCGACGKPFGAARKWRGVARATHATEGGSLFTTSWLLCGRCTAEMKRDGLSPALREEARAAAEAGQLLVAEPRGHA